MTKTRNDGQLSLDFDQQKHAARAAANVIPFIDSATIEARRTAVRRVLRSGIFAPPKIRL